MAKSRSESTLRGAEGNEAISRDSPGGAEECPARAKERPVFVIARSTATKQSQKGQPEMRQARKTGLLNIIMKLEPGEVESRRESKKEKICRGSCYHEL